MIVQSIVDALRIQAARASAGLRTLILGVPIRAKILGMILLPVLILGFAINFWVRESLSDWLSWILDPQRVDVAMQAGGRSIMLVTVLAAGFSLLVGSVLILVLTNPLLELKRTADQVRSGDLERRAPVRTKDEIGQVAGAFNRMLDRLVESQELLSRSNRRLGALVHVASSVGRRLELEQVLDSALSSTLDVTGLGSGWIYLREADGDEFTLASAIDVPPFVSEGVACLDGPCACERDLLEDHGWAVPKLRDCRRNQLLFGADEEENVQHLSVPLKARGLALGILNLLWSEDREPGAEEIDILQALGAQISEAVANARLHADVREKEAGMEILVNELVRAQEDERSRLSAELHDGAGQELTSLLLRLKAVEGKSDNPDVQGAVQALCTDRSQAIEHVRELSHQLRPPDLDQLGLAPTLRYLVDDMLAETGVRGTFDSNLEGYRLDPNLEITLYRIAQEALTNVIRHAEAGQARLSLHRCGVDLELVVEDDGVGFNPNDLGSSGNAHIGLASIQERTERMGGTLEVKTGEGQGTRLMVRIPG
ncbi:MAG: ATP-binding protein [Anaerolineales bacterium]